MSGPPGVVQSIPQIADLTTMTTGSPLLRARLIDMITESARASLTLITAPAGYGKSTLVSQWVRSGCHKVAWVALGPESNSPSRFLSQLAEAVEWAWQDRETSAHDLGSIDGIVGFLRSVAHDNERPTIVFDDYHHIENQDVHEAMESFVRCLSGSAHLILIGRVIPSLSIGRLQVEGAVRHVTEADLRFTPEEAAAVVRQEGPGRLTDSQIASLVERTEGWIAGIRLALTSLERIDPAAVVSVFDAWPVNRWLDDYIVEEVLSALPTDVRGFVLRTAILPELTPELCNAVLGIGTSAGLIDEVRRQVVFVRPVDGNGEALAYHPLFAESVARIADREWPESDRHERHCRAARWYEAHGQLEEAIDHAIAAEAWPLVTTLARAICRPLTERDLQHSRLHWLRLLPESVITADADLTSWYITALQYTGQLRDARRVFEKVRPRWLASDDPILHGHAMACERVFASLDGKPGFALRLAYQSLALYPLNRTIERLHAWTGIMQGEFLLGNDTVADLAHREAARCRQALPGEQWWWTFVVELDRANARALRGQLDAADQMYRHSLANLSDGMRHQEGRIRFRLATLALERNAIDEAVRQVALVQEAVDSASYHVWHPEGLMAVARVQEATGDVDGMERTLRAVRDMYQRHGGTHNLVRLEALEVALWLHQGQVALARNWMARVQHEHFAAVRIFGDPDPRLALAWALLTEGELVRASELLHDVGQQAVATKRWAELVPVSMWQVVARLELGDAAGALEALRTALRHGVPGGFVRSFQTPGYDLIPFLRRVGDELPMDEFNYAVRVLDAGDVRPLHSVPQVDPTFEPVGNLDFSLSDRESEVLTLLHNGCTNQQIADHLFITERTVKKHVGNILRKLNVSNRTAAVVLARERGLLK